MYSDHYSQSIVADPPAVPQPNTQSEKHVAEHDRKTLDLMRTMVARRPSKRVVHCSDCGEQGHSKGYMTCQYPQN